MWTYKFDAPAGERMLKRFRSVTTWGKNKGQPILWWCYATRTFRESDTDLGYRSFAKGASSHAPIRSFKAFKRFLRKHPELKGYEVVLCNRFEDHNVTAIWQEAA